MGSILSADAEGWQRSGLARADATGAGKHQRTKEILEGVS